MARTALTPTKITLTGISPSGSDGVAADVSNGNYADGNNGSTLFVVAKNTSVDTEYDLTFVTPGTHGQGAYAVADEVKTIAFGVTKWYGPFPLSDFTTQLQIDAENAAIKLQVFYI
jgi:hypothetical protein